MTMFTKHFVKGNEEVGPLSSDSNSKLDEKLKALSLIAPLGVKIITCKMTFHEESWKNSRNFPVVILKIVEKANDETAKENT